MPSLKKPLLLTAVLVVSVSGLIYIVSSGNSPNLPKGAVVLARVGDLFLTKEDILGSLDAASRENLSSDRLKVMVQHWVDVELLVQAARTNDLIDMREIKRRVDNFEKSLLAEAYINAQFRDDPIVTEREIIEFYNRNIESYKRDQPEIRAYHFLLETKDEAEVLKQALTSNRDVDMADLLPRYSGTLRTINRDNVIPEIAYAVFGSRRSVVGPIETEYGFHVLQLIERFYKGDIIPIDELRDKIIKQIKLNKQNRLYYETTDSLRLSGNWELNKEYFPN